MSFLAPLVAMTSDRFATARTAEQATQIRAALDVLCASSLEAERVAAAALLRSRTHRRGRGMSCEQALRAATPRQSWVHAQRIAGGRLLHATVPRPAAAIPAPPPAGWQTLLHWNPRANGGPAWTP